jgi:signal transduction histidine kinase
MNKSLADKIVDKLSLQTPLSITFYTTIFVLFGSVINVYIFALLFGIKYTNILLFISIALPIILTPITILILIVLTRHLKHFKEELEIEIKKNKAKDIMLYEQAKFSLMGEMMANISHQWKQPLNTIGLCIVNIRFSKNNDIEKNLDIIEDNISYLASTIDDFTSFFDKKTSLEVKELENIIDELKSIIEIELKNKEIKLEIKLCLDNAKIKILSSISQVILNLLSNAKDSLENTDIEDKRIKLSFISKNDNFKIVCCDNGSGIDANIREKIFNPYFTTKHKTQGTGIGLYMSKQIVHNIFNGSIELDRNETCFYVTLPYSTKCILQR